MKIHPPSPRLSKNAGAFTLVETMIALAILTIGSGVLYQGFLAAMVLTAKNTSLNEGNTSLQWSYYRLLSTLESAAVLVDCANYDPVAQTFTAVPTGTWGNSVRFMRLLPITCYVKPDDNSGYSVTNPPPPTTTTYLQSSDQFVFFSYNPALYNANCVTTSARVYPSFPLVSGTVSGGTSPGVKPGLAFTVCQNDGAGTLGIYIPGTLGSTPFLYCNRAYFMVEAAFAVTTSAVDGHKELIYFSDTSQTSNPVTISQKLDGGNQTQPNDATIPSGGTSGTFCMAATLDAVQTLLPIRSLEFVNVMSRFGGSAARNNTWIRVNSKFRQRQDF